jgi:hypothetical protein
MKFAQNANFKIQYSGSHSLLGRCLASGGDGKALCQVVGERR